MHSPPPARTMLLDEIDGVVIVVHSRTPPADSEWDASLERIPRSTGGRGFVPVLVRAENGPNAMQRARLSMRIKGTPIRTALLTDSPIVRGVVLAMQWMGLQDICACATRGYEKAFTHLEVPRARWATIERRVHEMEAALGIPQNVEHEVEEHPA